MRAHQIISKGEGKSYPFGQDHCFIKLASTDTNGELCLVEDTLKPGFFLPRHHHKKMFEVFYVLEGEVEYRFDDEVIISKPGDTVVVPPNVWHEAFCKYGGKMLTIFKAGSFDLYLERLAQLSEEEFRDSSLMKTISEEFDIYES